MADTQQMKVKELLLLFLVVNSFILVKGSCPSNCSCASSSSGSDVYCDSRSLGNIPADLPNDTYKLSLQFNSILDVGMQICKKVPQLLYIYLFKNQLYDIPVNTFEDCELLQTIHLHYNNIQSLKGNTFINMKHLQELFLHYNEISIIEPFTFMNLSSLSWISLNQNKIQSLQALTFINMTKLDKLYLHVNEISTIEPFTFMNLPSLRIIYLNHNNISEIADQAFGNLTSLTTLGLSANPLHCNCSIFPFWSWLIERASIGGSAICSNGTFVISLQSSALDECKRQRSANIYVTEDDDAECDDEIKNERLPWISFSVGESLITDAKNGHGLLVEGYTLALSKTVQGTKLVNINTMEQ